MTSEEIGKWLAFDELEPIGQDWDRTRQAISYLLMPHGQKEPLPYLRPALPEHQDAEGSQ